MSIWDESKRIHKIIAPHYPMVFSLRNPVPFKIGIGLDVAKVFPQFTDEQIRLMFGWLTFRRAYLIRCIEGAARHGLDGLDGVVTKDQAAWSADIFAYREKRALARRSRENQSTLAA